MKRCPKCKTEQPLVNFHRSKKTKDGFYSHCKNCWRAWRQGVCQDCGGVTNKKQAKRCKPCAGKAIRGSNNYAWKGGRSKNGDGYIVLSSQYDHQNADSTGRILEHVYVMSEHLGRPLTSDETVHHINGVRDDNRVGNLQLRVGQHGKGSAYACSDCGSKRIEPIPLEAKNA